METLFSSFKGLKVAVIGDIMLDHYIWGDSERISPEAPVPVVDVVRDSYVPGGAANVALNVAALGGKPILCGCVANDDAGEELRATLHSAGVAFDGRFSRNAAPTILKTRVVVRNQQLCRLDREAAPTEYSLEADDEIWQVVEETLKKVDAVILSDYAKGVITNSLVEKVKEATAGRNVFLAMDPKPRRRIDFDGLDLVTPNKGESLMLSQIYAEPHMKFPAETVCQKLWERYKTKHLIITLGGDGMLLSEKGHALKFIPTVAREIYDVSGAGDTVISALTLALAGGASIEEAAHLANAAAGVVVSKVGTATASPEEVIDYVESVKDSVLA